MIQDIAPHHYDNQYHPRPAREEDAVVIFDGKQLLLTAEERFPTVAEARAMGVDPEDLVYLFTMDDMAFFLLWQVTDDMRRTLTPKLPGIFRTMEPFHMRLACATAIHLNSWYRANQFCGCCGSPNKHDVTERAMRCTRCGNIVYPRINPAIIVVVRDGDRALLTHYADRPMLQRYALVAGFTEIGETLEDTVRREVLEETGIHVKNVRYHGNQPWGISGNLMVGFWADLDGDASVTLDTTELNEAVWLHRSEIPPTPNSLDLTHTMIEMFRLGQDPK